MRLAAATIAATMLGFAVPAASADLDRGAVWHHHHHRQHGGWRGHGQVRHVHRTFDEAVEVVEYREPYLPRGVLYNAPPLPLAYAYGGFRRNVISAKY